MDELLEDRDDTGEDTLSLHDALPISNEHQFPKWAVQLLKDVRPNEQNKTRTRGSQRNEGNISLIENDFTKPSTYQEAAKHKEWQQTMVDEY